MKYSTMVFLLLLSIGLTSYAVHEFVTGDKTDASASQLNSEEKKRVHNCFATVGNSSLELSLPGNIGDVIGVGFHQAERAEAIAIKPAVSCMVKENSEQIKSAILRATVPTLFVMNTRGRQSAATSAMDIAMKPNAAVYSPVDGVVTEVKTYSLYSKVTDYHIEIQPDGYPDLRVAIIHIDNVALHIGQRVERQNTLIGRMRALPEIQSQIKRYLPEGGDHVHIQVNPASAEGKLGS